MVSLGMRRDIFVGLSPGTRRSARPLCMTSTNSPPSARSTIWKRFFRNSVLLTLMAQAYHSDVR